MFVVHFIDEALAGHQVEGLIVRARSTSATWRSARRNASASTTIAFTSGSGSSFAMAAARSRPSIPLFDAISSRTSAGCSGDNSAIRLAASLPRSDGRKRLQARSAEEMHLIVFVRDERPDLIEEFGRPVLIMNRRRAIDFLGRVPLPDQPQMVEATAPKLRRSNGRSSRRRELGSTSNATR